MLGIAATACGPNYRTAYDGDSMFERCQSADRDEAAANEDRAQCWYQYVQGYSQAQTPERVQFANRRLNELRSAPANSSGGQQQANAGRPGQPQQSPQGWGPQQQQQQQGPYAPNGPQPAWQQQQQQPQQPGQPMQQVQQQPAQPVQQPQPQPQPAQNQQPANNTAPTAAPPGSTCASSCRDAWGACNAGCGGQAACVARCDDAYRDCMRGCY